VVICRFRTPVLSIVSSLLRVSTILKLKVNKVEYRLEADSLCKKPTTLHEVI